MTKKNITHKLYTKNIGFPLAESIILYEPIFKIGLYF